MSRPVVNTGDIINQTSIEKLIPANIYLISACKDDQTSQDVWNSSEFKLPKSSGLAGGACTLAFLEVVYANKVKPTQDVSWIATLSGMRQVLKQKGFQSIPQLTASRNIDVRRPVNFAPTNKNGAKRALLIGINYSGTNKLSGCQNDVFNMKAYLKDVWGFQDSNIVLLVDDGVHTNPTRQNIMAALWNLVQSCKSGDACTFHFSGHGGRIPTNTDSADGYDETICPVDYDRVGQIRDTELYNIMAKKMPAGVVLMCLMDCCHSGTVLNLPYICTGDGQSTTMSLDPTFNLSVSPSVQRSNL